MKTPKLSASEIRHAMRCAATCDSIVTSDDWLRAFWYDEAWSMGIAMGKYDNGSGDHILAFFGEDGSAIIKGFDHESGISPHARDKYEVWPGIYDGVPPPLMNILQDDSVEHEEVTFCVWTIDGNTWLTGNPKIPAELDDGSGWLLDMVQMTAEEFVEWGQSYYEDGFDRIGVDGVLNVYRRTENSDA